ncbi:hypothetical protein [Piscinibacter sakaiensis]|uniref:hypothetical protein n=1 Tax=Piscinibacter sakaiensis TaxID=1547922 RepID=UPI003AAFB8AA
MAIGWFTVLKSVPWGTVIENAPVVADGAKKLWKAVASRNAEQAPDAAAQQQAPEAAAAAKPVADQLAALRAESARLEELMLASSELINALAEQNAQLVEKIELLRARTLVLTRLIVGVGIVAAGGLGVALFLLLRG